MRYLIIALFLMGCPEGTDAQNLTAPLIAGSWQSTYHNPAMGHFLPDRVTLGLPGASNDLRLENVRYEDIFFEEGGRQILRFPSLAALAGERNAVQDLYSVETFGLAVRAGRTVLSGYHRLRAIGEAEYPRSLVEVLAFGNAPFIGTSVELAPRGQVISFQEVGLGGSYAVSERVAIGGRIKYLAGNSAIQTGAGNSLRLNTGEANYALTLEQDLTVNTVRALKDYVQLDSFEVVFNPSQLQPSRLVSKNTGLAFDVGIAVNLDRLRLNASVTDLGAAITWKEEVSNLNFSGSRTFGGLDLLDDLLRDTVSLTEALDSLTLSFEPTRDADSFRSEIGASYYLGGEYDVTDRIIAGAMLVLEQRLGQTVPAVALTGRYAFTDWLQVGVNFNYRSGIRANVGMHVYASPGRVRLFVSSDKLFTLLTTGNSSLSGLRLGAALVLGQPQPSRSASSFLP